MTISGGRWVVVGGNGQGGRSQVWQRDREEPAARLCAGLTGGNVKETERPTW